jgi:ASC-1-like (ASCH) protein
MIKDNIKNPERIGMTPSAIVEGTDKESAIGLHSLRVFNEVGLTVSKHADDTFLSGDVRAVILSSEKAHALGKALIELSGIEEEPVEDKPLHISLEEFRELREGDQVILRDDTASDEVFKFGYYTRFRDEIQGKAPVTITKVDPDDDSIQVVNSNGRFGWFTHKAIKEVASKAPRHISKEEFDSIEAGDKVIIRKDLAVGEYYGGTYFNANMRQWAADGVQLKVMPLRSYDGSINAENIEAEDYFNYSREMIQEVIKAPKHISKEEFDSIEVGDKIIIRKDLVAGSSYGSVYFTPEMAQWAADEVPLRVIELRVSYAKFAQNERSGETFSYSKEMIQEVIKGPKEHFRVRLSTKIWYAGKGGQITLDKDLAAIMNKPHAENVVKKYGGQLVKVDYSELEDK